MNRRQWLSAYPILLLNACRGRRSLHKLRVSAFPGTSASGLYLAEEAGCFQSLGLEVEIRLTSSTPQTVPLLASGQLDASFGALSAAFLNAAARGLPIRIVAVLDRASPRCGGTGTLYGRRAVFPEGLTNLRRLKGRRVAISARSGVSGFFLDILLGTAGMSSGDVQVVELRQEEAVAALVGGNIDAAVCSHGELELDALSSKIVRGLSVGEVFPDLQYSFAMFGPSLLGAPPEIGIRFLTAYFRGARDYQLGKRPRALRELARAARPELKLAREACHWSAGAEEIIDPHSVQRFLDWALRKGFCRRKPELAQLIDTRYLGEAQRRFRDGA